MSFVESLIQWTENTFLPFGGSGLFLISFMESSFFPIPPDLLLIPLVLLHPEMALWYALICTIGSTMGSVLGYKIGRKGGRRILKKLVSKDNIEKIDDSFKRHGVFAVGAAGFSPIPYKIFTIAAGTFKLDLWKVVVVSFFCRGARFFPEAIILMIYGEEILDFLINYFEVFTFSILVIAIIIYWFFKKKSK